MELNNIINQQCIIDISRVQWHDTHASQADITFTEIHHILGHKTCLNNLKKKKEIQSLLSHVLLVGILSNSLREAAVSQISETKIFTRKLKTKIFLEHA